MRRTALGVVVVVLLLTTTWIVGCERAEPTAPRIPPRAASQPAPAPALAALSGPTTLSAPYVYVANSGNNTVSVLSTYTHAPVATIPVGTSPQGIALTPDGAFAFVANAGTSDVSVIRTSDNTVVSTVPVGASPHGVALSPDGTLVYVTNTGTNTVTVFGTGGFYSGCFFWLFCSTGVADVPVGVGPQGITPSPDGQLVYVANAGSGTVSVIATTDFTVSATITVGGDPQGIAITPNGQLVFVTSQGFGLRCSGEGVTVISTTTNTVLRQLCGALSLPFTTGCPQCVFHPGFLIYPLGVAITSDGTNAIVTYTAGWVIHYSTSTFASAAEYPAGS
ncbi:MAG TPA: beta-propeller fold lactonase family protein, partial [Steroidobacteraceae bacterium]